jgi:hypothetical protein
MPKDSRARTRATRTRMAATGETYTRARAGLASPPRMDRDTPPDSLVTALMFGELMAAGRRAAITAPGDLAAAAAAVQTAITPLWPQVTPEAARDVLVACALQAVARGIIDLPASIDDITAGAMLELTAGWVAAGSPGARFTPPVAYASSAAFDRDEDAATLAAVSLLMAVAHPAAGGVSPEGWPAEDEDWPACPECGGDDPKGTYGCECFNPSACSECGDPDGRCDCWI